MCIVRRHTTDTAHTGLLGLLTDAKIILAGIAKHNCVQSDDAQLKYDKHELREDTSEERGKGVRGRRDQRAGYRRRTVRGRGGCWVDRRQWEREREGGANRGPIITIDI